jgi:hypothetical protein
MAMDDKQINHAKWNSPASLNNAGLSNRSSHARWNSPADLNNPRTASLSNAGLNSHNSHVVTNHRDVSLNAGMIMVAVVEVVIMAEVMVAEEDKFRLVQ